MAGRLKARDPATGLWLDVVPFGPGGPEGPTGPAGPTGPTGSAAFATEVHRGPAPPDLTLTPAATLWYDSDAQTPYGSPDLPAGGAVGDALVKVSNTENDTGWAAHLSLAGGMITGNLAVTPNLRTNGALTSPTVAGNVNYEAGISALSIEDRTAYTWETWNPVPNFAGGWESWGDGTVEHGPCVVARNKFMVVVSLCFRRSGVRNDDSWEYLFSSNIPVGWRPQRELFDTRQGVEDIEAGTIFETKLNTAGQVYVRAKKWSLTWSEWTAISVNFSYPRYG